MRWTMALLAGALGNVLLAHAQAQAHVQFDPFAQATAGCAGCPAVGPRLVDAADARIEPHARIERGTRCAMAGTCEPGGAYRRDPEINEAVRAALATTPRFADTSVWLTTSRRWVTLEGCVRSAGQRKALVRFIAAQPRVERVFDELRVGTSPRAR